MIPKIWGTLLVKAPLIWVWRRESQVIPQTANDHRRIRLRTFPSPYKQQQRFNFRHPNHRECVLYKPVENPCRIRLCIRIQKWLGLGPERWVPSGRQAPVLEMREARVLAGPC
ncbi:hypothetical protein Nepgr_009054 [Nepenthes gracilis]|uniref:Uncharacterized protein n=1 Tax=Nepenthes gracilis TaxID=150966 RepID=A0AAD3XJW3_NEPGR|nr:hypothetical protein Nepgr_009054 [Nepenthes gracilis]